MDAYVIIKLLKSNGNAEGIYIAVNRCVEDYEGSQAFQNLKAAVDHFLKVKLNFLIEIPESTDVRKSIINQNLLVKNLQSNLVVFSINSLISKISKIHQVSNINQSALQCS
jgi:MinD-like ATPase involved in chromosome partitioning or flagellar assembly